ncbi:MAG: hypothetical protein KBS78_02695 [Bacteroidales bacterium]|nr:hypothetical protein [Candidatus Cryptobacteroides faecihippi]
MNHLRNLAAISLAVLMVSCGQAGKATFKAKEFQSPDICWRPVPLWFWNNTTVTEDGVREQVRRMIEEDGYGGCAILPFGKKFQPEYLGDEYMALYGAAIDAVRSYGGRMSLYDEYGFPSGSMGAINGNDVPRFMNAHPGSTLKRLDKEEYECFAKGETVLDFSGAEGKLMALTAVCKECGKVLDLKPFLKDGILRWSPGEDGKWTVMAFRCKVDGDPNVDYLDPEAVKLFVEDTHGKYFQEFGDAFGTTITTTFFDEPTMYRCDGRVWTDDFNDKFKSIYGVEPDTLYPMLWYDLGEGTVQARCRMFGLRSRLYSEGFMKTISDWSREHGIVSTGHQDQEEILNTSSVSGDLMLCGKFMGMPGIDKIGGDRPAEHFYKVISSSAENWGHDVVMSETYGAMGNISFDTMYGIAIDQYTKGITDLIPHAAWYDDSNVTFLPELSVRNPIYRDGLPDFNKFLSRLRYILARPGKHVADIAVLYPVQTQYAGHHLDGELGWYAGGVKVEGTDYDKVSMILTDTLSRDFTYLHPERFCELFPGDYKAVILPGVRVIDLESMKMIKAAAENGAPVVFTSVMPQASPESEADGAEVAAIASAMVADGLAVFVETPDAESIEKALAPMGPVADVLMESDGSTFNYLHKIVGGHDVYYFGNLGSKTSKCTISLLGVKGKGKLFNPHTGEVTPASLSVQQDRTLLTLELDPARSCFLIFK